MADASIKDSAHKNWPSQTSKQGVKDCSAEVWSELFTNDCAARGTGMPCPSSPDSSHHREEI